MIINILEWIDNKVTESLDETQHLLENDPMSSKIDAAFRKEQHYMDLYAKYARRFVDSSNGRTHAR